LNEEKLRQFEPVFFPKSIAVVGASPNPLKFGNRYLEALIHAGFKGKLYPIHPSDGEISGLKAYPTAVSYTHLTLPTKA